MKNKGIVVVLVLLFIIFIAFNATCTITFDPDEVNKESTRGFNFKFERK